MSKQNILNQLNESMSVLSKLTSNSDSIEIINNIASQFVNTIQSGNKILIAGNGGSASDSQHIAGELVGRFNYDRPGIAAFSLNTDTTIITAVGNDYGYENIFSRQVQAVGSSGDIFLGISTSGTSPNIVNAFKEAKKKKMINIGFCGLKVGNFDECCDLVFRSPSKDTPKIQEIHIMVAHTICSIVETTLFPKK
tara:strand:- start:5724 stop:6308 length:585 start_codon:yes stop_codon:yes gene_type:complete